MPDDDLRHRLTDLAAQADLRLPSPRDVRIRGDRHRAAVNTAAAGLTVIAVLAVAVILSFAQAPPASLYGGDPEQPFPSGTPVNPSARIARPSAPPTTFLKIPAGLVMLHEGEPGWTADNDAKAQSALNPCGGADVTAIGRVDARTLRGPGHPGEESHSPAKVTHQLFLYDTEQAATTAFAKLSAGGCGWAREPADPSDTESNRLAELHKPEEPTLQPGVYWHHHAHLVRTGNALLIAHADSGGAGMTSNLDSQELSFILIPLCEARLICNEA